MTTLESMTDFYCSGLTAAAVIKDMYFRLLAEGLGERAIAEATGLRRPDLDDPDAHFPSGLRLRLWELAIERLQRADIGLSTARDVGPEDLGVAGYVALNSKTLGEAGRALGRFHHLISQDDHFEHRLEGELSILSYDINSPPSCRRQIIENVLACNCSINRKLTGTDLNPVQVHFTFPEPDDLRPYRALFRCPVHFRRERNALIYHQSVYRLPIPTANQYLKQILARHAEQLLNTLSAAPSWRERTQQEVIRRLHSGRVSADDIAHALGVSRRTLQRRLAEEGALFSTLVRDVQKEVTLDYMKNPGLSLAEIALLVGFSEPSAFHRAFRKWVGQGTQEYRRALARQG